MHARHKRPPKLVEVRLPSTFSSAQFITELQRSIKIEDHGFKGSYLHEQLLSKYCDPKTTSPRVRKELAIKKWLSTELRNSKTNLRLMWLDATEADLGWVDYPSLVNKIRAVVTRILGPLSYPDVLTNATHTNGASTRVPRGPDSAAHKLEGEAHVSASAIQHWFNVADFPRLGDQNVTLVESSVLFTVPKNSDIDRVACKEPEINMLMQRSVGQHIRRRLKRIGVDLTDQTVNQRLAQSALKDGLATIDLSSASDSISSGLVASLLPFCWYSLLDDLRVKHVLLDDGQIHNLEMFSSMGNGFTFELESLLFYAITSVVCRLSKVRGRVSVYGDDIIAPSAIVPRLIRVFSIFGFKTNEKKTFWTGDFRESCGKHYYRGFDVSPFFVRREVSHLPDLINILNQVAGWASRSSGFIEDPNILDFHLKYASFVPEYLWGGSDIGDNTCLVTGHAPRYRLTQRVKIKVPPQEGALTHWFMTRENTELPFSVESAILHTYKAKRASSGWTASIKPWFART